MVRTLILFAVACMAIESSTADDATAAQTPTVSSLREDLKSPNARTRRLAAEKLGKLKAIEAVGELIGALQDEERIVRSNAQDSLVRIGAPAVPALAKQLIHGDEEIRLVVVTILERMGPAAQKAIPELTRALKDKNNSVKLRAAVVLCHLGAAANSAIPALIETATDPANTSAKTGPGYLYRFTVEAIQKLDPKSLTKVADVVVPRFIQGLQSRGARLQAAEALRQLGPYAESAVPALEKMVFEKDASESETATQTLAHLGEKGEAVLLGLLRKSTLGPNLRKSILFSLQLKMSPTKRVVVAVADLLKDEDVGMRHAAAEWLRMRGRGMPAPMDALLDALRDQELAKYSIHQKRSFAVADALAYGGEASVPGLVKAFESEDQLVQWQAAHALALIGRKAKKAIAALQKGVKAGDDLVRLESAHALLRAGVESPEALEVVRKSLQHPSPLVREEAIHVVFGLGRKGKALIPQLVTLLDDSKLSQKAENALSFLKSDAAPAVPEIIKRLKTAKGFARIGLLQTLEAIGPGAKDAVPLLIDLLPEKDGGVRARVVSVLAHIGPAAAPATPGLIKLLKDADESTFERTIDALGSIGPGAKAAIPTLLGILGDATTEMVKNKKHWYERGNVARALGQIGPDAAKATPALKALLEDEDFEVRAWAAYALARITGESKVHVGFLVDLYRDSLVIGKSMWAENDSNPTETIKAISMLGSDIEGAIPALVDALHDPREEISITLSALHALRNLGPKAKSATPHLVRMLKDRHEVYRAAAAEALGAIGPDAKEAIPALTAATEDNDNRVSEAAADALQKVRDKK